jgi:RNA ligase
VKHYHTIEKNVQDYIGQHTFGFDKIDGSNFCAEWNKKLSKKSRYTNGFKKFGTRTETIKNANNPFVEAVNIFMDKYSAALDKIFCENKTFRGIDTITVYGEFFGEHSFAGMHNWKEEHDVVIYDMFLYKKDYVKPADFIDIFGHLDIPQVITRGLLNEKMIQEIVANYFNIKEGVVFKGVSEGKVWMVKCKTQDWLDKVRALYGVNNNLE